MGFRERILTPEPLIWWSSRWLFPKAIICLQNCWCGSEFERSVPCRRSSRSVMGMRRCLTRLKHFMAYSNGVSALGSGECQPLLQFLWFLEIVRLDIFVVLNWRLYWGLLAEFESRIFSYIFEEYGCLYILPSHCILCLTSWKSFRLWWKMERSWEFEGCGGSVDEHTVRPWSVSVGIINLGLIAPSNPFPDSKLHPVRDLEMLLCGVGDSLFDVYLKLGWFKRKLFKFSGSSSRPSRRDYQLDRPRFCGRQQ